MKCIIRDCENRHTVEEWGNAMQASSIIMIPNFKISTPTHVTIFQKLRSLPFKFPIFIQIKQHIYPSMEAIPSVELLK